MQGCELTDRAVVCAVSLLFNSVSLRSKRFQSSYCATGRAGAKKNPLFCSRPNFPDELARKPLLRKLLRCLCAEGQCSSVGPDCYRSLNYVINLPP